MSPEGPPRRHGKTSHDFDFFPRAFVLQSPPGKTVTADMQSPSDEDLAEQVQAGSLEAFEQLVSRYEGRIFRFVNGFCRREADAREITQDAFIRAFQAIARFDKRQPFAPWLFTIARRKGIDYYRSAPLLAEGSPMDEPDFDDPAELLARQEERQDLWRLARLHLPATQYQALWLRYVEDMTVAQIAKVMRKTTIHIKVLLFRARHGLGRELEKPGAPSSTGDSAPPQTVPLRSARLSTA
jgi:RNA polymerase sigma-70 factor (ECF subfamily)